MTTPRWIRLTGTDSIPPREGRAVMVGALQIAVFNMDGRFLAIDNRCPHQGGPLADGLIAGGAVVCPLHAWKVDLDTGVVVRPASAACVHAYPIRVEAGVIEIELAAPVTDEADGEGRAA